MKKLCIFILIFIVLINFVSCILNTPLRNSMVDYYKCESNYEKFNGIIASINNSRDGIVLEVTILDLQHNYPLNTNGNQEFLLINSIEENFNLEIKEEVTLISAPKFFYNGHILPVVYLEKNGEVLLEYTVGKECYLNWIVTTFD